MNPILEKSASWQTAESRCLDENYEALEVKPHIPPKTDFSEYPEANKRKVENLVSKQFAFCVHKAPLEQTGRTYFLENLPLILSHNHILSKCPFFETPMHLDDGSIYTEIKTVICSNGKDVEGTLRSLRDRELAFIVYHEERGSDIEITLSLFSNKSGEEVVKKMIDGYLGTGLEFFGIAFFLGFNSDGELTYVGPGRGVNEKFRRNKICSSVSRAALENIYKHLGSEKTKMKSFSADHIGTVKFYYPLNCFFRKSTSESLRDVDPRSTSLTFDDIEKRQESLDVFNLRGTQADCPDKYINLEKLLLQYQVRDFLMRELEST